MAPIYIGIQTWVRVRQIRKDVRSPADASRLPGRVRRWKLALLLPVVATVYVLFLVGIDRVFGGDSFALAFGGAQSIGMGVSNLIGVPGLWNRRWNPDGS